MKIGHYWGEKRRFSNYALTRVPTKYFFWYSNPPALLDDDEGLPEHNQSISEELIVFLQQELVSDSILVMFITSDLFLINILSRPHIW